MSGFVPVTLNIKLNNYKFTKIWGSLGGYSEILFSMQGKKKKIMVADSFCKNTSAPLEKATRTYINRNHNFMQIEWIEIHYLIQHLTE